MLGNCWPALSILNNPCGPSLPPAFLFQGPFSALSLELQLALQKWALTAAETHWWINGPKGVKVWTLRETWLQLGFASSNDPGPPISGAFQELSGWCSSIWEQLLVCAPHWLLGRSHSLLGGITEG